ncbi:MAG: hypothetical protein FJ271_05185 [Planctomycetes bacterium]|nr:hypothetical protein [Planctomycetota bacterium]
MGKVLRWCWPPMIAAGILVLALQGTPWAQSKMATADTRATDKIIYLVLRDVANRGAHLFNKQNDWPGCYRVYEGGLITVKPFLAHRPDLQKAIDDGIQNAESLNQAIQRAFALRKVIDAIREDLKSAPTSKDKSPTDKKVVTKDKTSKDKTSKDKTSKDKTSKDKTSKDKKTTKDKVSTKDKVTKDKVTKDKVTKDKVTKDKDKKKEEKKVDDKKSPAGSGNVSGKVMVDGKTGAFGFLTLISKAEKRSYSTAIGGDGAYAFRTPIPTGTYTVIIETLPPEKGKPAPVVVPERYRSPATSGLSIEVRSGAMVFDVMLQK